MSAQKDDPIGIPDDTRLFRRINPQWIVYDENVKAWRPNSQNFQDSKDGTPMSVFAENVAVASGETPLDFLKGQWEAWSLSAITAG